MKDIKIELNASNASGEAYWRKRCDEVETELSRLRAEVEILVWNLAGISTMACCRTPILYNGEMARPALDEVAELVKDYDRLRAVNAELVEALKKIARGVNCPEGITKRPDFYASQDYFERIANAALSRAEQAEQKPETCVWKHDEFGTWTGGCGGESTLTDAPEACPGCGKRIEVKK